MQRATRVRGRGDNPTRKHELVPTPATTGSDTCYLPGVGYQVLGLQQGESWVLSSNSQQWPLQAERHHREEHCYPLRGKDKLVPFQRSCFQPLSRAWLNGANLGARVHLLNSPSVPSWQRWSKAPWHFPKYAMAAHCKSKSSSSCVFNHSKKIYTAKL